MAALAEVRMGFRIQLDVDHKAVELVRHLKRSPAEVFGRPYAGYLIIMATEFDHEVIEWLKENVIALDSVTGGDVAFAVFTRKFRVPVGVRGSCAPQACLPELPLREISDECPWWTIERLVRSGKLGWLADKDELTLVTYGTDEMARAFGVVADLPCLLIIDALPQEQFDIMPLQGVDLDTLFRLIRYSVGQLIRTPSLPAFRSLAEELAFTEEQIRTAGTDVARSSAALDRTPPPQAVAELVQAAYERARVALSAGATRQFVNILRESLKAIPSDATMSAHALATEKRPELLRTDQTIRTLTHYLRECSWPLAEPHRSAYARVLNRHVVLHRESVLNLDDSVQCAEMIAALRAQNAAIVDSILQGLPTLNVLVTQAVSDQERVVESAMRRLEETKKGLDVLRARQKRLIRELGVTEYPSLSAILGKVARQERLAVAKRKVGSFAGAFAGAALSPSTLLEVARAAAGQ
ncbi:hypothetical protein [Micromonospora sp. NPDC007230]|uniref:hypothetical protein n=1 Tax=Micromonospora sp. NPDC007230 TaxID=3364237 RepID=UPI0036A3B7C9